jgi:hypothetical protein
MYKCEVPSLNGVDCDGHLGKFGDCLAQALWEWSLDGLGDGTGSGDFEGWTHLFDVERDTPAMIEPDGIAREIEVPAGAYLLFVSTVGAVTYMLADSAEQARAVFQVAEERYEAWERGCDPNELAEHAGCADYDVCLMSTWSVV